MKLTPQFINAQLAPYRSAHKIFIGYSGGVDSHVLLHLLVHIPELKQKLIAVYVHHGLQVLADSWALHCQQVASNLSVNFKVLKVNARALPKQSPEEVARNVRYQAFKNLVSNNDVLLFAQHRDDQLETVLLQMFRGVGLKGLSGMSSETAFAHGKLLRPLLNINQQAIECYARQHDLQWIEDPSNQETQFERNYLRHEIIPLLKKRWPSLDKAVARTAMHCAEAQSILSISAGKKMHLLYDTQKHSLSIPGLLAHDYLNQQWILREWLHYLGVRMPTKKVLATIMQDILLARPESNPVVTHDGYRVQRYREDLYLIAIQKKPDISQVFTWIADSASLVLTHNGVLWAKEADKGIAKQLWQQADIQVKYRQGGEKIALPKRYGRHSLKKLYQEVGIAYWKRDVIPLIYINGVLAVIGNDWVSADFYTQGCACISVVWDLQRSDDKIV